MPDVIDANGLVVKTAAEITAELSTGMQSIYGPDINIDQNSPDGQMIGIVTQEAVDIRELAVGVNNSFDPDQATGVTLDQRCAINNIQRQGGTYTNQPITIVTDRTVSLQGLDANFANPNGTGYTVQDGAGNQFILVDSATLVAGTHAAASFRAKQIGEVNVPINTIVNPVTIVLGVVSVNNPSAAIDVGKNQETDPQLRTRRQSSVAIASDAYLDGMRGALLAITGVTQAEVYQNDTGSTDANNIPAHSMWAIVAGGANTDIARVIYAKKSYGAPMKGDVSVNIITSSGALFVAKFDRPTASDLYIRFNVKRTVPNYVFDTDAIKKYVADNLIYRIGEFAETSLVTEKAILAIQSQGGGGVPVDVEISDDNIAWTDFLNAPTLASEWTLDVARITVAVL